jgi:hypothetical protein
VWITSSRAGSALVFPKVCAVPRGTSTNPSRPTVSSSPSTMIETSPSSTKYASEQFVCRRGGGRRPAGRQRAFHQRQVAAVELGSGLEEHLAAASGVMHVTFAGPRITAAASSR